MSQSTDISKRGLRERRRAEEDDEHERQDDEPQDSQKVVKRRRAPNADPAATLPKSLYTDPVAAAAGSPLGPKAPLAALPRPTGPMGSAAAAESKGPAVDIFKVEYDSFTAEDLYKMLASLTRQEVEKRIVEHEQELRKEQQQQPQVERFLDAVARPSTDIGSTSGATAEEVGGYRYSDMLNVVYVTLNRDKESSAVKERNQLISLQLERIGKKKVIITNFGRVCQAIHRPVEDVKDFIEKELSIGGNLDINDGLILKYEVQKNNAFDKIIIKYMDEYVKCNSCHKIDTTLTKEGRRMELRCNWCTATRSVQAVGSATYSAQVGKRSKARMQAMTL